MGRESVKNIKELELVDVLSELPDINQLDCNKDLSDKEYDIFLCASGFEERCLTIPEQLASTKGFKCKQVLYFEYSTNSEDNEANKQRLLRAFQTFADSYSGFQCDREDFTSSLREYLNQIVKSQKKPKIIFDISTCSSKLLTPVIGVVMEFDLYLHIVYSEAAIYHPTIQEYSEDPKKWTTEEGFGIARGVGKIIPSPEYPGVHKENPDLIIAFTTFKPERTKAIITYIDESLLMRPGKRIIWIVGDPHMEEEVRKNRKNMIRDINKITDEVPSYEVCTLNYKKTLEVLDQIYKSKNLDFHINISVLGSKMQSLGISIFCYVRPDVSVFFAIPKEYNPSQYSEGCKATWQIEFGNLENIKSILDRVGQLETLSNQR
jgi:hypothetical protein